MNKRAWLRVVAVLMVFGLVAAACGDDEEPAAPDAAATPEATTAPAEPDDAEAPAEPDDADEAPAPTTTAVPVVEGELAGVCPSPLVVQTDWFPESEHGAMYELIGEGYSVDKDNGITRGPMVLGGTDLGIEWEVRAGGPFLGGSSVSEIMALDDSIHLGYASTDQQVNHWDVTQLVSVVAPLERNPQMVMWDPEVYPNLSGIHEIGERDIVVQVFSGGTFPDVFIAQGIWSEDQVDKGYTGSPARFIADGDIAQQGFASAEPYQYEFVHTDYGRPVAFELLHDAGFEIYSQTIGVRNGQIEEMRGCLEKVVPIIQQASVDFSGSPDRANAIIVDAVAAYDTWWSYSPELAAFSVQAQRDFGLVGDGPDNIAGNMEGSRFEKTYNDMVGAGMQGIDPDLTYDQLFTNEFIDPNISYGFGDAVSPLAEAVAAGLGDVCPSPLVVQTDWFPESEHGAMYELIGEGYSVDKDNGITRGPMVLGGTDLGVEWEVRAGGPFLGGSSVSEIMALDDSIHLGYASTDQQVNHWDVTQLVSVVAPLEKNPQMVMWDPEQYPDLSGIHEIGERGIIVQVFSGGTFPDVFIAQGIWDEENVDKGYTGSPARFIADGDIAQQGFASAEPYQYEFVHTDYGRPVAFELLHDAGFEIYSQTIGVRNGDIEGMRGCLERLVPIIQQASVDFSSSPDRANAIIVDAVAAYDTWWSYSPELAVFSVQAQRDFGLVGDGPDNTAGNMVASRFEKTFNDMVGAGMQGIDPDLTPDQLFTNEFIDPNISYGF
ncbi:MAG: hypothetical protein OXC00_09595 [Acidimicrobiaceae bacterium]|nr:hypothetical protein [Acidimicrobiaceae bacterium]